MAAQLTLCSEIRVIICGFAGRAFVGTQEGDVWLSKAVGREGGSSGKGGRDAERLLRITSQTSSSVCSPLHGANVLRLPRGPRCQAALCPATQCSEIHRRPARWSLQDLVTAVLPTGGGRKRSLKMLLFLGPVAGFWVAP